jgi:hypothetical protein
MFRECAIDMMIVLHVLSIAAKNYGTLAGQFGTKKEN